MATLIDGKAIAEKINKKTAERVQLLKQKGITPRLEVILVGDDKASLMYGRLKGAAAIKMGIEFELHHLLASATVAEMVPMIQTIQSTGLVSGLILQLPLPNHLYVPEVLNVIDQNIDVDFLTNYNLGALIMNTHHLLPPTPGAVITVLAELAVDLPGKNVTIIGTGALVGKPLAVILMNKGASVTTCNSKTKNITEKCLAADIIVTGVGKKDLLRGAMVSEGTIIIDTGLVFDNDRVCGDVNVSEVAEKASFLTPTPGGVGPITVALLLWNTVLCAEKRLMKKI